VRARARVIIFTRSLTIASNISKAIHERLHLAFPEYSIYSISLLIRRSERSSVEPSVTSRRTR